MASGKIQVIQVVVNSEAHEMLTAFSRIILQLSRQGRDGETCALCSKEGKRDEHDEVCPTIKAKAYLESNDKGY